MPATHIDDSATLFPGRLEDQVQRLFRIGLVPTDFGRALRLVDVFPVRCLIHKNPCLCESTEAVRLYSDNHAIKGVFFANRHRLKQPHFIISSVEHPAVTEPLRFLETLGARVTRVPVDEYGLVDPADVQRAIEPETVLISIMLANNEVGTIQPIEEIAAIARAHGVLLHTDAAQAVGKIPVDVESMGVDMLSIAGHKLYAPQGIGALYVREGIELAPLLHGAGHEGGRRAGTENILEIAALGAACQEAADWIDDARVERLRDYFWKQLQNGTRRGRPSERTSK